MYIAAGVIAVLLILGLVWLFATVDDWSRDLTTNHATTSETAKNPSLHPIIATKPPTELAELINTASQQLRGWTLAGQEKAADTITLRFVRITRLMRFKD